MKNIFALAAFICAAVFPFAARAEAPGPAGEEEIRGTVEELKSAYEQANPAALQELLSPSLPDRGEWLDRAQSDFFDYHAIRLYYSVQRKAYDDDGTAVWDLYWQRKALTRDGRNVTHSALISFRFRKEGARWVVTGLRESPA